MDQRERAAIREEVAAHAESIIAGVEERWGDVPRLDPLPVSPLPHHEDAFPESAGAFREEFYDYAAGAAITDDAGRLCCVYTEIRDEWGTPGGAADPGETPAETARRETLEETGLDCEITGVCYARTMDIDLGPPETLPIPVVVFTGRPVGGEVLAGDDLDDHGEIGDVGWFGPEDLPAGTREYDPLYEYLTDLADGGKR